MSCARHLFATAADFLPGLERFEEESRVRYIRAGLFDSRIPLEVGAARDLPDFGLARSGDAGQEDRFLVVPAGVEIAVREVPQRSGRLKFAIDQLQNPDSTIFQPGGLYRDLALISGEIATTGMTAAALELHRLMVRTVTKGFKRVRSYWLGAEALMLMSRGMRLTASIRSPATYDLREDPDVEEPG
jgi:hypothetical protein